VYSKCHRLTLTRFLWQTEVAALRLEKDTAVKKCREAVTSAESTKAALNAKTDELYRVRRELEVSKKVVASKNRELEQVRPRFSMS